MVSPPSSEGITATRIDVRVDISVLLSPLASDPYERRTDHPERRLPAVDESRRSEAAFITARYQRFDGI